MKKFLFIVSLTLFPASAFADTPPEAPVSAVATEAATPKAQPVEISAGKSLEWNRKAKTYTARENVVVTQGDIKIRSSLLTAHYTDDNGATDISTLDAQGDVTISAAPYTAYGDHAVYDVKTGGATLTGKDLKITMKDDVLTAKDRIEFSAADNILSAVGGASALHGGYTLRADTLSAHFTKDASGKMTANEIIGRGHVSIKGDKETVTGDKGVYDVASQKAVLTGKVRVLQGESWLEGTRADVDMATGISRLSGTGGGADGEGRVKGVFYPKPKKPPEQKEQQEQPEQQGN